MPAPPLDSSDEDLPPPSSLFNQASARASTTSSSAASSRPRPALDAPARRSSPRRKPSATTTAPASARSTAPTAPRSPSTLIASASNTPAATSTGPTSRAAPAQVDPQEQEERERHRRLAEELFPPSPPRPPPAPANAPPASARTSSSSIALDRSAQPNQARTVSPDLISDSEVERSAAGPAAGPAPAVKAGRRAHKGRRTSSAVFGLSDSSEDEGDLAARMHDLGLRCARPFTPSLLLAFAFADAALFSLAPIKQHSTFDVDRDGQHVCADRSQPALLASCRRAQVDQDAARPPAHHHLDRLVVLILIVVFERRRPPALAVACVGQDASTRRKEDPARLVARGGGDPRGVHGRRGRRGRRSSPARGRARV